MPLKVETVLPKSIARKAGLQVCDTILRINGNPIRDFLDLQFFSADATLQIEWERNGEIFTKMIHQNFTLPFGVVGSEHNCRTCINDCIFCFIDQMHPNLRASMYLKDDDVPFSFVFGNFITLTNLTEADYKRIITQKLSPLYISVHTTNPQLHKKMVRHPLPDFSILQKLHYLTENNIQFHTQIVLVPGYNDGAELKNTLQDLTKPELNTISIGIVPIGLTRFRENLTSISAVHKKLAQEVIELCRHFPRTYLADEFFLLAESPIPKTDYYDDYPQLENGIGMLRLLMENWETVKRDFINELKLIQKAPVFVTGKLAVPYFDKIAAEIQMESGLSARTQCVTNLFWGESVTVGGLLTAQDILEQTILHTDEIVCFSSNIFNGEMLTLDNVSLDEILLHFGNSLIVIDEEFAEWEIYV
jgi:putative radical SAM enzyme (TIGR03279 family)